MIFKYSKVKIFASSQRKSEVLWPRIFNYLLLFVVTLSYHMRHGVIK